MECSPTVTHRIYTLQVKVIVIASLELSGDLNLKKKQTNKPQTFPCPTPTVNRESMNTVLDDGFTDYLFIYLFINNSFSEIPQTNFRRLPFDHCR